MDTILHSIRNINIRGTLSFDQPLSELSSFRTGGPADVLARPADRDDLLLLLDWAEAHGVPWFILGGGANILVSDKGIRGLVIATSAMNSVSIEGERLIAGPGAAISDVSARAAAAGLGGLEFIYSMPGSVGGAVWMNARCYGGEISEILEWVDYLDMDLPAESRVKRLTPAEGDFAYKISPFQKGRKIILDSCFMLHPADPGTMRLAMEGYENDRRSKGHFAAPCAGSVFKNNREFGAPSGQIIDSLGMRGIRRGGALISHQHANIIVNDGGASSDDIAWLMDHIHDRVKNELGFDLEAEVIKVGNWS